MRNLRNKPQRPSRGDANFRDTVTSYRHARDAVISTQQSFSAVELLGQTLTGDALALFEQIPPDQRGSYDQAMAAMLESYVQIRAKNQDLVHRLARVADELRALQTQIFQAEGGQLRLLGEIAALHQTAAELRVEEQRIAAELPAVSVCEEFARSLSLTLDRELAASRNEYWTEIGRYFKNHDLGTPVDYASPLQPLAVQTERRVEVHDERLMMPVAAVASIAVVANWSQAFPIAAVATRSANGSGNEAEFRDRLSQCVAAQQEYGALSAKANSALIESEQARYELKLHLAAQRAADRDRNVVTVAVEHLRAEVGLKAWELEQRTSGTREWLSQCVDKRVEIERWKTLKVILDNSLQSPVAARSMYAHLHLANEVTKTISQAPDAILHSDDPRLQADRERLMSIDRSLGERFVREVWGAKSPPPLAKWMLEKLLRPEKPKSD